MVVDRGVGEKPVGGSSHTHARTHTHTHWLGSSAHLQLLGLAPTPPLAVDALVTLPDEEHPGVSGVDETVGSLHGGLLEHSRLRVVLPPRQGCRPSRLNALQGVAGLASSGPLGPRLCQQYCPPRQHSLSPGPFFPATEDNPREQPLLSLDPAGEDPGRGQRKVGCRASGQVEAGTAGPLPASLQGSCCCVPLHEDQTTGLPRGSGRAAHGQQAPNQPPGSGVLGRSVSALRAARPAFRGCFRHRGWGVQH